jgi:hypothetical protein
MRGHRRHNLKRFDGDIIMLFFCLGVVGGGVGVVVLGTEEVFYVGSNH